MSFALPPSIARHQPVAVELGLDHPVAGRRRRRQGRELRLDPRRQRRLRQRRQVGRRRCGRCRLHGGAARGARLALLDQAERRRHDAVGQGRDHVVLGQRPRPFVLLLEQHPWVLAVARLGDPHQLPQAGELLAVQPEQQLALGHAFARVAHRLPGAAVPDDHFPGAVLLRRDRPFEAGVVERMVLDVDRHLHLRRVVRRPLRHRPAQQHAVVLEAEVVVQPARPVLLDDEDRRRRALLRCARPPPAPGPARACARSRASGGSGRAAQAPCSRMRPWRREDATRPRVPSPLVDEACDDSGRRLRGERLESRVPDRRPARRGHRVVAARDRRLQRLQDQRGGAGGHQPARHRHVGGRLLRSLRSLRSCASRSSTAPSSTPGSRPSRTRPPTRASTASTTAPAR